MQKIYQTKEYSFYQNENEIIIVDINECSKDYVEMSELNTIDFNIDCNNNSYEEVYEKIESYVDIEVNIHLILDNFEFEFDYKVYDEIENEMIDITCTFYGNPSYDELYEDIEQQIREKLENTGENFEIDITNDQFTVTYDKIYGFCEYCNYALTIENSECIFYSNYNDYEIQNKLLKYHYESEQLCLDNVLLVTSDHAYANIETKAKYVIITTNDKYCEDFIKYLSILYNLDDYVHIDIDFEVDTFMLYNVDKDDRLEFSNVMFDTHTLLNSFENLSKIKQDLYTIKSEFNKHNYFQSKAYFKLPEFNFAIENLKNVDSVKYSKDIISAIEDKILIDYDYILCYENTITRNQSVNNNRQMKTGKYIHMKDHLSILVLFIQNDKIMYDIVDFIIEGNHKTGKYYSGVK